MTQFRSDGDSIDTVSGSVPGVAFNPPPADRIDAIQNAITNAFKSLPSGSERGALIAIANEKGVNAAVVVRTPVGFEVVSWIGKSWKGSLEYGAAVRKTF